MSFQLHLLSCDDRWAGAKSRRHLNGLMQTDPTEDGVSPTVDGGFTQAWDTVGAGKTNPRLRELI
jgi:hypothetical protein